MFVGHAAPAFIAKLFLPNTQLGALLLACGLPDILTFSLATVGIETFRFNKNKVGALPYDFLNPYTHSLLGMMIFGAIYGAFYLAITSKESKGTSNVNRYLVILALTASHWILEIPVHRIILDGVPFLPTANSRKFGYGLFDYQLLENVLELGLFVPAALLYKQYTQYTRKPAVWYENFDYVLYFFIATQLFVCAAPRFVYETTPDTIMCLNAVALIVTHAFMLYRVDAIRALNKTPAQVKLD